MKDPCDTCLVRVTCWQTCEKEKNFMTILRHGLEHHRPFLANHNLWTDYKRLIELTTKHDNFLKKVRFRSRSMSKEV